jgi:Response regulators consisting of a CheY-like receiver domain and a winged-helix DNA-binding domain
MRMNLMDESSSENEGSIVLSMDSEDGNITRTKTVNINGEQQEDTTNIPFEMDARQYTKLMSDLFAEAIITTHNIVDPVGNYTFNSCNLHVFITKLRRKLSKDESIRIINVRGIGYKLLD